MKKMLFLCITLLFTSLFSQKNVRNLSTEKWEFSDAEKLSFKPAKVPGTVHSDLYTNSLIPDPFFSDNEQKIQWIEHKSWIYKTNFKVSASELKMQNIELNFEGLDTFAEVFLNGKTILNANNMFRNWQINIKKALQLGDNELKIIFSPASVIGKELSKKNAYPLPENERVFVRKAQYHFGWDWGPRFVTAGLWKDVRLVFWDNAKIRRIKHRQHINKNTAIITFTLEIDANASGKYQLDINQKHSSKIYLEKGKNFIEKIVQIQNPKLWWSNGLGEAHLYDFNFILGKDKQNIDTQKVRIGIRTLKVIQEKDSIGSSFYFKLNGIPVYAKGANLIPLHSFLPEVSKENYKKIVQETKYAGMNMLRVWGGGIYEADDFYDLCDENGILVWQDFAFACAMYPGDDAFLDNVKSEIEDQVNRLQNHPSLALWCGNNENDEGWHNWGWQKQLGYSKSDSAKVWKDYLKTFRDLIPTTICENSFSDFNYWESSPSNGWGRKIAYKGGDVHYWGVWWGMEPFEKYREKTGRFVSEYGFQGMPPIKTLQTVASSLSFDDPGIKNHQKHKTGYETITTYMARDYQVPTLFEDFNYVSQLLQARGMQTAIEAHRIAKPYNMGSLYWQLNDCWPVTSWSSIDFYGNRKASHYQVRRSFSPLLFTVKENNNTLELFAVNDLARALWGKIKVQIITLMGKEIWKTEKNTEIPISKASSILEISKSELKNVPLSECVLKIRFEHKENPTSTLYYFVKPKELHLEKPKIQIKYLSKNSIEISSNVLAKDVYLISENAGNFEDNFFDLLPGETKKVSSEFPIENLRVKTLYDVQK